MPPLPRHRPRRPSWMDPIVQRMTPTVKVLVVTQIVLSLFYFLVDAAQGPMLMHLSLGPLFLRGEVWQLVTSLLFNTNFGAFAINLLGLWFMGSFELMHG